MTRTVHTLFAETVAAHGDQPAYMAKRGGRWEATTWRTYRDQVHQVARGLMHLGVGPGANVSVIGFNRPEWFLADLGAFFNDTATTEIYTTSSPEQCQYIIDHSDSVAVVVEDAEQLAKIQAVRDQLPKLKAIVLMEGSGEGDDVHTFEALRGFAEQVPAEDLQARIDAQQPDDVCTLIYTSGTTGPPKGVMISHGNILRPGAALIATLQLERHHVISYLPLSHIAEQVVSLHGPMVTGGCTWFAESFEKLGENLRDARPHLFLGVPRVWEKIQEKMVAAGKDAPWLKKKIAAWARRKGLEGGYAIQEGRPLPRGYGLADKLVFSKVRERLGLDRCQLAVTSAAPIGRSTLEFFLSLGIPLLELYGMSEVTEAATISLPDRYKTGKAGFALPGTELKIAADGEVCMRGFHVCQGYWKNEEATRATIDEEGWLHSGDIGELDAEGFLQITDRKKELIITAGGENIAPQLIEGQLKSIPVVSQAVVVGDRRKYLAALLTLDPEKVADEAVLASSNAKTPAEASTCEAFQRHLQTQVDEVNATLARVQTIKKWSILPAELTVESGELTPTMKLRRKEIGARHAEVIESLYA
jgi:long-subunit acyl-CoA synthetase (AMP-forming)